MLLQNECAVTKGNAVLKGWEVNPCIYLFIRLFIFICYHFLKIVFSTSQERVMTGGVVSIATVCLLLSARNTQTELLTGVPRGVPFVRGDVTAPTRSSLIC